MTRAQGQQYVRLSVRVALEDGGFILSNRYSRSHHGPYELHAKLITTGQDPMRAIVLAQDSKRDNARPGSDQQLRGKLGMRGNKGQGSKWRTMIGGL